MITDAALRSIAAGEIIPDATVVRALAAECLDLRQRGIHLAVAMAWADKWREMAMRLDALLLGKAKP